eukprot:768646-Hanusia_phi.AAC.16
MHGTWRSSKSKQKRWDSAYRVRVTQQEARRAALPPSGASLSSGSRCSLGHQNVGSSGNVSPVQAASRVTSPPQVVCFLVVGAREILCRQILLTLRAELIRWGNDPDKSDRLLFPWALTLWLQASGDVE